MLMAGTLRALALHLSHRSGAAMRTQPPVAFPARSHPLPFPSPLVSPGMWMVRPNPIATGWIKAVVYMIVKLILVPMLMVGCCFAVDLHGPTARAAVLVATLPVSAGSAKGRMQRGGGGPWELSGMPGARCCCF